jgi:hypothetical protein
MKTQPELQAIQVSHDSCNADNREVLPALQTYEFGQSGAGRRHDHILRAALLANACTRVDEAVEKH